MTVLVLTLNATTNNHNVLFHAKMKRRKFECTTQNFLWCFSKSRCLQEVCITTGSWTPNVHTVTLPGQLSWYIQHYLSIQLWVYTAFVLLPINRSLSLLGYQTNNLGKSEPFARPMVQIPLNFQTRQSGPLFPNAQKALRNYFFSEKKPPDIILYWICSDFWKHLFHTSYAQDDQY